MGGRSNVENLPLVAREAIERGLRECGFRNYSKLAERFRAFGVSRSSIARYGRALRARLQRERIEREILGEPDGPAAWLASWARDNPSRAEQLVRELRGGR